MTGYSIAEISMLKAMLKTGAWEELQNIYTPKTLAAMELETICMVQG